jgi:lipoate-protein ligase A
VDKNDVYLAFLEAFTKDKDYEAGTWNKNEISRAKELAEQKYKTREWLFLR